MENKLFYEFEEELNKEAKRIIDELINLYNRKILVNKPFDEIIKSIIKKEYNNYIAEIESRIYLLLPYEYSPDNNEKYALVSTINNNKEHLLKYSEYCRKKESKNHVQASKELAKWLIKYCDKHPYSKLSLGEFVSNNLKNIFKEHCDSTDYRTIILFIEEEIESLGFIITSLTPLRINKLMI